MSIPNLLSIAGSDPSGGAGIQADLKTFAAHGGYGMCAITALTAQNTQGVTGVHPVPVEFISAQLDALLADVRIDAIKVGMVASEDVAQTIAHFIDACPDVPVVVDPVMVAKSGDPLVDPDSGRRVGEHLLPRASVVTPNTFEAARLAAMERVDSVEAMREAARRIAEATDSAVLVKGGALAGDGDMVDVLAIDASPPECLHHRRVRSASVHGTGCTLSSAIAANLARGAPVRDAVADAKHYVAAAIAAAADLNVGTGHGPLNHTLRVSRRQRRDESPQTRPADMAPPVERPSDR